MKQTIKILMALMLVIYGTGCASFREIVSNNNPTVSGEIEEHEFVDLGLPSGTQWATCNVGASKPAECGAYYAWGETSPKEFYSFSNYKWSQEEKYSLTKYTLNLREGYMGDSLITLETTDDAATVNWGSAWKMPTDEQLEELYFYCDWKWTDNYNGSGVAGQIGTSKFNGNIIFLPAAGCWVRTDIETRDANGNYRSCRLDKHTPPKCKDFNIQFQRFF